jgi:hypothetical protein
VRNRTVVALALAGLIAGGFQEPAQAQDRCGHTQHQRKRIHRAARRRLEASRKDTRRIMRSCKRRRAVPVRARRFRGSRTYTSTHSHRRVRCATRTEGVVYRDILGWTLGSYKLRKTWCWRRHRITDHPYAEVYGDVTTPGAIVGWGYDGEVSGGHHREPYNGWRRGSHVSWSQGHFSVCILKVGCYNNPVPSVRIQGIYGERAKVEVRK